MLMMTPSAQSGGEEKCGKVIPEKEEGEEGKR